MRKIQNIKLIKIFLTIFLLSFFGVQSANAAVTFTNGKWETTFDCADWIDPDTLSCDNLTKILDASAEMPVEIEYKTKINVRANNPDGLGGGGISFVDAPGTNISSAQVGVIFPSPQKELWIRWYMLHPIDWDMLSYGWEKIIFLTAGGDTVQTILEPESGGNQFRFVCQGDCTERCNNTLAINNYSWSEHMGGHIHGDGLWHSYEMHLKMDTYGISSYNAASDGIGKLWIDGELRIFSETVNYSHGSLSSKNGWEKLYFSSNQSFMVPNVFPNVFYDDMVIYNTTPPNIDSYGNPFIGPIIASSITYSISNFTTLISNWLHLGSGNASDINIDGIINTKDLGIMMSKWE